MQDENVSNDGVAVHTGFPNPAIDGRLSGLDFNKLLIRHAASTYMFKVEGNAWEKTGVFDGDIAVIDRALDPRKSDAVVWWDEQTSEFAITTFSRMPHTAKLWGVVTATIHRLRKD